LDDVLGSKFGYLLSKKAKRNLIMTWSASSGTQHNSVDINLKFWTSTNQHFLWASQKNIFFGIFRWSSNGKQNAYIVRKDCVTWQISITDKITLCLSNKQKEKKKTYLMSQGTEQISTFPMTN